MRKSQYTEEQIAFALKQAELGTAVAEVCRKMGVSETHCGAWVGLAVWAVLLALAPGMPSHGG